MRVPALPKIDPIRLDCLLAIGLFVLAQVELWPLLHAGATDVLLWPTVPASACPLRLEAGS